MNEPGRLEAALVQTIVARFDVSTRPAIGDLWNAGGSIFEVYALESERSYGEPDYVMVRLRRMVT